MIKPDPYYTFKYIKVQILVNINNFWYRDSTKSLQCSHMQLENFDKTGYQLRLIPQQSFYTVCHKARPLHYCNMILKEIMKC